MPPLARCKAARSRHRAANWRPARIVKVPRNVFISYSHRDKKWFQLVRGKLGILEDLGVTFWTDLGIEAGDLWDRLI